MRADVGVPVLCITGKKEDFSLESLGDGGIALLHPRAGWAVEATHKSPELNEADGRNLMFSCDCGIHTGEEQGAPQ